MADPDKQLATMLANIPDKTGKSLQDWIDIINTSGLQKHGEIMKLLKGEYGVSHGFANLLVAKSKEGGEEVDLVAEQYSGGKASLRSIHDAIVLYANALGGDVEIAPKKTSVSLRRKKQFALITPATKTRIDLGLALKGDDPAGRLESYNAMCSHRVRIEDPAQFDHEVQQWLREAYNRAG